MISRFSLNECVFAIRCFFPHAILFGLCFANGLKALTRTVRKKNQCKTINKMIKTMIITSKIGNSSNEIIIVVQFDQSLNEIHVTEICFARNAYRYRFLSFLFFSIRESVAQSSHTAQFLLINRHENFACFVHSERTFQVVCCVCVCMALVSLLLLFFPPIQHQLKAMKCILNRPQR